MGSAIILRHWKMIISIVSWRIVGVGGGGRREGERLYLSGLGSDRLISILFTRECLRLSDARLIATSSTRPSIESSGNIRTVDDFLRLFPHPSLCRAPSARLPPPGSPPPGSHCPGRRCLCRPGSRHGSRHRRGRVPPAPSKPLMCPSIIRSQTYLSIFLSLPLSFFLSFFLSLHTHTHTHKYKYCDPIADQLIPHICMNRRVGEGGGKRGRWEERERERERR